jgi:hypothetical protein
MSAVLSWEMNNKDGRMERNPVNVLRDVWSAQGQTEADLADAFGPQKSCKRMSDVGFDDLAEPGDDLREAWRATLDRDGKLRPESGTVADLVLGLAGQGASKSEGQTAEQRG